MSRRFIEDDWIEEWARVCKHGSAMVENLTPPRRHQHLRGGRLDLVNMLGSIEGKWSA